MRAGGLGLAATLLVTLPIGATAQSKQDLLWAKLEAQVARIDERFDGVLAITIEDLTDGRALLRHADEPMPAASMIKIPILAELYRQNRLNATYVVDRRDSLPGDDVLARLTPGSRLTLRDVAVLVVAVSDNSATNVLIDRLGMDRINGLLDRAGLAATRLRRRMLDLTAAREGRENLASPAETVALLRQLYRGELLGREASADLLTLLSTAKQSYLPRLLPEGVRVANKPGWLEGVRADAGIVYAFNRPFAIAVMATYAGEDRAAEAAIAEVGLAAFRYFDRLGRGSPYGRTMTPP